MKQLKKIFVGGLALALPLAVLAYVFIKITRAFEKIISPVATQLGIERLLGELTLTFLAILCILILMLLLGMLMQLAFIAAFKQELEAIVFRFFPWLNQLKLMAADTLDLENVSTKWKPVLLYVENSYFLAFLVDESEKLASFYIVKGTKIEDGEIQTIEKEQVKYFPIEAHEIRSVAKQYGRGVIGLVKKQLCKWDDTHLQTIHDPEPDLLVES